MTWRWHSQLGALAVSVGCVVVLGYADYRTDFDFDLFLFYALPVALTAWGAGRVAAVGMGALALTTRFCANVLQINPYTSVFYLAWNTALRSGWLLIVALTLPASVQICSAPGC